MASKLPVVPIPGMSLTKEPGSRPWEQAPKLTKLSEVVSHYSEKLSDPKIVDSILSALKQDIPAHDLAIAFTKYEMMKGVHSVDTGKLAEPVIVELIITLAELNDIGYVLTAEDKNQMGKVDENLIKEALQEVTDAEKERQSEEKPLKKSGLMAKGDLK